MSGRESQKIPFAIGSWNGAILPGLGLTFRDRARGDGGAAAFGYSRAEPAGCRHGAWHRAAQPCRDTCGGTAGDRLYAAPRAALCHRPAGLSLTLEQLRAVGVPGLAVISVTLAATFVFTKWAGRLLGSRRGWPS